MDKKNPFQKIESFVYNYYTNLGALLTRNLRLGTPERLKQHIYYITKTNKTSLLYSQFREHRTINLLMMGVESSLTWTLQWRLSREAHWIRKLNTIHPNGLNEQLDV